MKRLFQTSIKLSPLPVAVKRTFTPHSQVVGTFEPRNLCTTAKTLKTYAENQFLLLPVLNAIEIKQKIPNNISQIFCMIYMLFMLYRDY